jgi:hypothetical protein
VNYILSLIHLWKRRSIYLVRVNFLCDFSSSVCFKFNPIWPTWKRYFFLDYNYILEEVMLLTVHGWPPKPEYINARQLCNQLMEQYVGKLHFLLRLCEIPLLALAKHHTTYNNSSRSILIAKSENMARISNDFYELFLLIHCNFGDIFLEEGPDYWYMAEHLSRKIGNSVYTHCFVNFYI